MLDLHHQWGGDLAVSSSGDLALAGGSAIVNQRVFRRLLTNPGDYLWNLDYGGGLAQFIGTAVSPAAVASVIQTQLALETAVPSTPTPTIDVRVVDPSKGTFVAKIAYADPASATPAQINVSTG